ncbi:urease accessory protein UreE [Microvirga sp. W0021]|uniref:Urease accessory protein UreE n=1 Tax=Hohaiivirga grylli TaxID=3133970 RepID=A0ABV0BHJ7_9HYPH
MLRVVSVTRKPAVKADLIIDTVVLDHEARQQKSMSLFGENGTKAEFASDKAPNLKDGDALKLEDGKLLLVKAANENLLKVTAENPLRLVRLAWQLGSQHALVEATADALFVERSAALEELVRGQGCSSEAVERPFNPEQAAHSHDCCHHDHDHGHHHHHHDHGEGCGCGGHGHDHSHHAEHKHDHHDHGECGCGGHGKHDHHHGHDHKHD